MLLIFCLLSLLTQSFAQVNGTGSCPEIKPRNFDINKILGVWYEYARIPNSFEEPHHVCVNCTFYMDTHNIAVMHVDATIRFSGAWYIWEGELLPTDTDGVYNLKYPWYASLDTIRATFVDADWDHWMILHVCSENSRQNQQVAWVWTKTPDLLKKNGNEVTEALKKINLPFKLFEKTDNQRCPRKRSFNKLPQ